MGGGVVGAVHNTLLFSQGIYFSSGRKGVVLRFRETTLFVSPDIIAERRVAWANTAAKVL